MQSIKLQKRSSNPGRQAPTADDINAAKQRIQVAMEKACQLFDDLGGIAQVGTFGTCHRRIAKKIAPISRFQYNMLI